MTATCASEALRKARKTAPDDVRSLEADKDGMEDGGGDGDAVGFHVEPELGEDEVRAGEAWGYAKGGEAMRYRGKPKGTKKK